MKTVDFIREHNACREGAKWALSISDDMADVWDELLNQGKHDWLLWVVTRPGVFPDSAIRKLACRFVRETPLRDGRMVWDLLEDERSRKAIEVTELYADGKATADELSAASAAAYAAYAAYDAARADADADADACAAASYAADAAYYAADAVVRAAALAACAAADAADAARDAANAAKSAQVKMIAELGNPFKKGIIKMSTNKHTPGPWSATRINGGWWIEADDQTTLCRRRIVNDGDGDDIESPEAYARLIAAAPEMLELLEDIEKELHLAGIDQRENNAHDVSSLPAKLCIRLYEVIQKAKGFDQ